MSNSRRPNSAERRMAAAVKALSVEPEGMREAMVMGSLLLPNRSLVPAADAKTVGGVVGELSKANAMDRDVFQYKAEVPTMESSCDCREEEEASAAGTTVEKRKRHRRSMEGGDGRGDLCP